jgi:hypothetical protein
MQEFSEFMENFNGISEKDKPIQCFENSYFEGKDDSQKVYCVSSTNRTSQNHKNEFDVYSSHFSCRYTVIIERKEIVLRWRDKFSSLKGVLYSAKVSRLTGPRIMHTFYR